MPSLKRPRPKRRRLKKESSTPATSPDIDARGTSTATQPGSSRRTDVVEILEGLAANKTPGNVTLMKWIGERQWNSLEDLKKDTRPSWADSMILPRLFETGDAWLPRPATDMDMHIAAMEEIQQAGKVPSYLVRDFHEEESDLGIVYEQLKAQPGEDGWVSLQENPVHLMNLPMKTLGQKIQVPTALVQMYSFEHEDQEDHPFNPSANLAPKFAFVDVHIDAGMEAISMCVHPCRKVWFLWPPTPENLEEMSRRNHRERRRLIQSNLNDGILLETDGTVGIHVPAGWLHATFTIHGGFLIGITPVMAESIGHISRYNVSEVGFNLSYTVETDDNLKIYGRGLQIALCSRKLDVLQEAIDGWYKLGPLLACLRPADGGPSNGLNKGMAARKEEIRVIWEDWLLRIDWKSGGIDLTHQCCHLDDADFPNHFKTEHLKLLNTSKARRLKQDSVKS
ncbi:MAG: hypothetical protein M1823_004210 [Watsoniomyces obsoletus]|nr:MAG: hypothetical protein M1823_004210 [Watsoniomyces obsoletus]